MADIAYYLRVLEIETHKERLRRTWFNFTGVAVKHRPPRIIVVEEEFMDLDSPNEDEEMSLSSAMSSPAGSAMSSATSSLATQCNDLEKMYDIFPLLVQGITWEVEINSTHGFCFGPIFHCFEKAFRLVVELTDSTIEVTFERLSSCAITQNVPTEMTVTANLILSSGVKSLEFNGTVQLNRSVETLHHKLLLCAVPLSVLWSEIGQTSFTLAIDFRLYK